MKKLKKFNKKTHVLIILILFILLIITIVLVIAEENQTKAQKQIKLWQELNNNLEFSDFEDDSPTFTNIATTSYYTPNLKDFNGNWCSPKKTDCFKTTQEIIDYYKKSTITECIKQRNAGYCCMPDEDRGFFEEVKCQGSGVANGKIYYHNKIKPNTQEEGFLETNNKNGITSKQTDPEPERTVAINTRANTDCYIPYWQKMYIYFGKDNKWNGVYLAEDTGSAFTGECKIDIYVGNGKDALNDNRAKVNGNPKIYLIDDDGKLINPTEQTTQAGNVVGNMYAQYSNTILIEGVTELITSTNEAIQEILKKCDKEKSLDEKQTCVLKSINDTKKITIKNNCGEGDIPINNIKQAKKINVSLAGYITQIKESADKKEIKINIEDESDNAEIKITKSETLNLTINKGDYAIIKNPNYTKDIIETKYSDFKLNTEDIIKTELKDLLKQIAECNTAQTNCDCNIQTNLKGTLTYKNGKLSTENKISISTDQILGQSYEFKLNLSNKEYLKKIDQIYESRKGDLSEQNICVPKDKYLLMCSYSDINKKENYADSDVYRFTVKIN